MSVSVSSVQAAAAPVLIMAGGTGGHVFPALAVADKLRARGVPLIWLGSRHGLENRLVPAAGITLERLNVAGLRGVGWRRRLLAPLMLAQAGWQAFAVLRRHRPRLVLGMGGFASGPGGVAARCLRIPLIVHEQNAVPGTTNRWLAPLAALVLQGFPNSFPIRRGARTVGNPVRESIAALATERQQVVAHDGDGNRRRLLVLGGSQGALAINQMLPQALAKLAPEERPQVWHQTGERLYDVARDSYREADVTARLEPFIDDMAAAYRWADLALARAGALTVAELAAAGVAALLVPFPYAIDDHQSANAEFLASAGAALWRPQADLDADTLATLLRELLSDPARLAKMASAARRAAHPKAADEVAELCLDWTTSRPSLGTED